MVSGDFLETLHARFRQDRYERGLYGASVVDAYTDLAHIRAFVTRRRPWLQGAALVRLIYGVFGSVYLRTLPHG